MKPRTTRKPQARPAVDFERLLQVKFANGMRPVLRRRRLVFDASPSRKRASPLERTVAGIKGGWFLLHAAPAKKLEALMARARKRRPKQAMPDLLSWYVFAVDASEDPIAVAGALRRLKEVEFVGLLPRPQALPAVPDFDQPTNSTGFFQGYLQAFDTAAGTTGIGAVRAWAQGFTGTGIRFCDVEYNFNKNHRELRNKVTILAGDPVNPSNQDPDDIKSHGTSVLGEFGSKKGDGKGTIGIAYGASLYFSPVITWLWPNIADAITQAATVFDEGDIIIVEQQIAGPGFDWFDDSQDGLVAVEWDRGIYDAIVVAVAAGITVVEAAGNGGNDFDSELFLRAGINQGHHPFRRANDSGAIIVGAGDSKTQVRRSSSNCGSRVDLQGWGNRIVTASGPTVRSDLWTTDGVNREYTKSFNGTSGATPIVAGACALVQQAFKAKYDRAASCEELRDLLVRTGNPQQPNSNGAIAHIGPLPDVRRALADIRGDVERPVFTPDPAGVYPSPLRVRLAFGAGTSAENAKIRFTSDGTDPTSTSRRYRPTGAQQTVLQITESTLFIARTFLDARDPYDNSVRKSDAVQGNYQIYDPSLPLPDLYVDEVDPYSGDTIVRVRVEAGYTLGVDAMIWYNINAGVDPIQFVMPNAMYMGRIRLSQAGTYAIRARYCLFDDERWTWTPGPVATQTFTVT